MADDFLVKQVGLGKLALELSKGQDLIKATSQSPKQKDSKLSKAKLDRIDKASKEFEAIMVEQMFKNMWKSVPQGGILSGSREEQIYRDMLNEELAKQLSNSQGFGIARLIKNEMIKKEK